jgi:hypothetical protein
MHQRSHFGSKIPQIKQLKLSSRSDTTLIALGWWYLKAKIVQDCKEPKIEMYKPIWGLVFKYNGSGRQFNSIQFSQEYNNQRIERKEKIK